MPLYATSLPLHDTDGTPVMVRERRCGIRVVGGIYWAFYPGWSWPRWVLPRFQEVDPEALGVTPIGVTMIYREGTYHILDWVGEEYYPRVASFLEEADRMGVSRRLPRNLHFDLLSRDSRLLLIHPHAAGHNRPAIFASVPLAALEVIRDPVDAAHDRVVEALSRLSYPSPGQAPIHIMED